MPQADKPKRYAFMDAANVVACFAVVMLHCSNASSENAGDDYWRWCVVVQSLFIFAVPFFFMISGANILGYRSRYSTADFFKKRASRILGVFLTGTILFYLVECFAPLPFGYVPRTASLSDFIQGF